MKTQSAPASPLAKSTSLYALIESRPHSLGELIDYADAVPPENVAAMLLMIGPSLEEDYRARRRNKARLRRLVIFGRLIERLAFEIEAIPKSRRHRI